MRSSALCRSITMPYSSSISGASDTTLLSHVQCMPHKRADVVCHGNTYELAIALRHHSFDS